MLMLMHHHLQQCNQPKGTLLADGWGMSVVVAVVWDDDVDGVVQHTGYVSHNNLSAGLLCFTQQPVSRPALFHTATCQ